MSTDLKRSALIMAAGTGGHIMPGLAIAGGLSALGWHVEWLGTAHGMENQLVPAQGITLHRLSFRGLRGRGVWGSVKGVFQGAAALLSSVQIMRKLKPSVVVGMGGYICLPGAWAARLCGVPVVLVNADADLLLSNKSLASIAKTVCCGFEGSAMRLGNAVLTGNPVRAEIVAMQPYSQRRSAQGAEALSVLVMGGSLGAQAINALLPQAIAAIPLAQRPKITHQAGAANAASLTTAYQQAGVAARVVPFINDVAHALSEADVVIARAGAITCSELAVAGMPSLLIPFVASTTAHQTGNAAFFASAGAAIHLPQASLTAAQLTAAIQGLNATQLAHMSTAAYTLAQPQATAAVVQRILKAVS